MRLIMAGGGTGGHLFPGLAVAREFERRDAQAEILFVGSRFGIESRVIPNTAFALETLPIRGLKGRGVRGLVQVLYGLPMSVWYSLAIIRRFRPQCIIGLGGYASGPLLVAGVLRRIRCAVMEQNLRPGITNRVLGWVVDRVFTSYSESAAYFRRSKVRLTGTPIRWSHLPQRERGHKFTLLIFGGSAGAHHINVTVLEALAFLGELARELRIIHQTGETDAEAVRQAYRSLPCEAQVTPFIHEMDRAYSAADLIVCRAGASTLAEIAVFGKPAILVPYPFAAHDHQRLNAQALKDAGAAEMILDRDLSGERLGELLGELYRDRKRLEHMGRAVQQRGMPDAAHRIVDECYALVRG